MGPGVTVGEGAVIGARAVVIRSQPRWMVCVCNPARPLKVATIRIMLSSFLTISVPKNLYLAAICNQC